MIHNDAQTVADFPPELIGQLPSPCYLISEDVIRRNCELLNTVQQRTGAKVLLALKAFALPAVFPLIAEYLHGVCASGPIEAQLGRETFGREVHTYAPAFTAEQMQRVVRFSDHIVFNSLTQYEVHREAVDAAAGNLELGLRVNPGHAEVEVELYNPCRPGSRFGVLPQILEGADLSAFSGLHFHALCEQNSDVLVRVLKHFEQHFQSYIPQMKWVNFGGGHHVTRDDYDVDLLCETIIDFRKRYNGIDVYLEPGEAVVLNGGVFITRVLDILHNGVDIAVLDCSAETHMPDVLGMPYRPHIVGSAEAGQRPHNYKLGGISCLAGDIIGDYSFDKPLEVGQTLVLTDMALYSFVKNTTFNGVELPALALCSAEKNSVELLKQFGYDDYRSRI